MKKVEILIQKILADKIHESKLDLDSKDTTLLNPLDKNQMASISYIFTLGGDGTILSAAK